MKARPCQVTIVAASAETLEALRNYLTRAGLGARGTRRLAGSIDDSCSAVVFFPDDFDREDVIRELRRLRRLRPRLLQLLVTSEPAEYTEVVGEEGNGRSPILIHKPAWGWTILDAIRDSMGRPGSR
jgi:hypothetical protein